ncbi:MAG: hypothetical protein KGJ13_13115, partial [Patescibacteria group bacterium]|nr:hypothetical protein [Patescibacteria group bacterium]
TRQAPLIQGRRDAMSKLMMHDAETGDPLGEVEIPDDILEAAAKVEAWMKIYHPGVILHGLKLADE